VTAEDAGFEGPIERHLSDAVAQQEAIFRDTFPGALGVRIDEIGEGFARGSLQVDGRVKNPGGVAHGGALAGFGDTLAAWATFTVLAEGEIFTTIEFKANFISGVAGGGLTGESRVAHRGGRTAVLDVKIHTDDDESRLVCAMIVTQAILRPERPETDQSRY
jgi:acyl-CoA thioesterase